MLMTRDGPAVINATARNWLKTAIFDPVMFIRLDRIQECDRRTDGRTDGHRTTAYAALIYSIVRQK